MRKGKRRKMTKMYDVECLLRLEAVTELCVGHRDHHRAKRGHKA